MKKLRIVANWKAHKTIDETRAWFQEISNFKFQISNDEKEVVICLGFHLLAEAKQMIEHNQIPFVLGAQDVSQFPEGAYTGEITAAQLKDLVKHTIIGHSERRTKLAESDEILEIKVEKAKEAGLEVIFCVQGVQTVIPPHVTTIAYEPVAAIGSGHADTPEDAQSVAQKIKENNPQVRYVLYGGSVTADNVHSFTSLSAVDGVLVGGASLDPISFAHIIQNA